MDLLYLYFSFSFGCLEDGCPCGLGGWVVIFLGGCSFWFFFGGGGVGGGGGLGGVGHSRVEQSRGKPAVTFPN